VDEPELRVTAGGHDDPSGGAGHDEGAREGHVGPVGQLSVLVQRHGLLGDGNRLAGESGLVDREVADPKQAHVGRDLVAGLQRHDIAGHELG
jgi:hypothetical protein